jgi:histidinol-phosphate/aromatic aminotransferase/cobyric acid decarboxylase-like protein
MNVMAQTAAIAALDDFEYAARYVAEVLDAREWLTCELRTRGFDAIATPGNFNPAARRRAGRPPRPAAPRRHLHP